MNSTELKKPSPLVSKKEVARRLGCHLTTVDRLFQRGVIPGYKLGYMVRFNWEEVLTAIKASPHSEGN